MLKVEPTGQLGNQMFQYAVMRIVAERNGYSFYMPSVSVNDPHLENISKFFPDLNMGTPGPVTLRYMESENQQYDDSIFKVKDSTLLLRFFQTEKYLLGQESKLREWFKVGCCEESVRILLRYPPSEWCYVHFRGTDYVGQEHYLPTEYYTKAMEYVHERYPRLKFLVITDDAKEAKRMLPGFEVTSNTKKIDFQLLYFAETCIIPNSTFSWWASWLSEKKLVVGPERWYNWAYQDRPWFPFDIKSGKFDYV